MYCNIVAMAQPHIFFLRGGEGKVGLRQEVVSMYSRQTQILVLAQYHPWSIPLVYTLIYTTNARPLFRENRLP